MKIQSIAVFLLFPGIVLISGCADEIDAEAQTETAHVHSDGEEHDHSDDLAILPVPAEEGPWPSAVAEEKTFDFGTMPVGGEKEHAFVIRNDGEADLQLMAGEPTCKCTAFELGLKTVKPGEETTLLVRWLGKAKDDSFQHGGPVYTNDPKRKEIRFVVKGIVDTLFDVFPDRVWSIGTVNAKTGGTMQGVVISRVHDDFEITDIACKSPHISTVVSPAPPHILEQYQGRCGYTIDVTFSPDAPPGLAEEDLTLKLSRSDGPVKVLVRAKMAGPVRVLPSPGVTFDNMVNGLKLGQFPTNKGRKAELTLLVDTSEMSEPFAATSIDTSPGFVKAELKHVAQLSDERSRYKLLISIPPGIPRTERDRSSPGLVDIQTNHPSGQTLKLKLSFKAF